MRSSETSHSEGTSPTKGRRRGDGTTNEQGTEQYIRSIIEDLNGKVSPSQQSLLRQLNDAFGDGKIKSHILRQPFDDAGNLKDIRLSTIF